MAMFTAEYSVALMKTLRKHWRLRPLATALLSAAGLCLSLVVPLHVIYSLTAAQNTSWDFGASRGTLNETTLGPELYALCQSLLSIEPQSRVQARTMHSSLPLFMTQQQCDPDFQDPDGFSPCNATNTDTHFVKQSQDFPLAYSWNAVVHPMHGRFAEAWSQYDVDSASATTTTTTTTTAGPSNFSLPSLSTELVNHTLLPPFDTLACAITTPDNLQHFPHTMQRIIACWSFWQHFPQINMQRVLVIPEEWYNLATSSSPFNRGVFQMLQQNNIVIAKTSVDEFIQNYAGDESRLIAVSYKNYPSFRVTEQKHIETFRDAILRSVGLGRTAVITGNDTINNNIKRNIHDSFPSPSLANANTAIIPRIAILNRKGSRRLMNSTKIVTVLQERLQLAQRPPVFYFEGFTFAQQVESIANIDILVSPHGAQLTSIFFMPQCGSVTEIFPHGYGIPWYFGPLAAMSSLAYSYVYVGENMTAETAELSKSAEDRWRARQQSICVSAEVLVEILSDQLERWRRCRQMLPK